jgi:adenine-specific DNA-methyltransferase
MTEPEKLDLTSHNLPADKTAELLRLFPEIRTEEGKIDFDKLKLVLGQTVDAGKERYGMTWPGKADCFKTIQAPSTGTLLPAPEESVDFGTTENLIIEGDNLNVLKLLQKAYLGKVKMIYIDPPYNTGNDFIYPDNYTESLQTYLEYTGQVDAEGKKFGTNADTDGRFHSRWLNMMYPRLYLARNLLKEDGIIFVNIGEEELANTVSLLKELFGEENQLSIISRVMKTGGNKGQFFSPNIDYIVVFSKNLEHASPFRGALSGELIENVYNQVETEGERKGERYRLMGLYQAGLEIRANQRYWIECPDGSFVIPDGKNFPAEIKSGSKVRPDGSDGVWKWTYERFSNEVVNGNITFIKTNSSPLVDENRKKSSWNIYNKIWLNDRLNEGRVPVNIITGMENRHSSSELKSIDIPFDFAKPSALIAHLLEICGTTDSDIILDFFAGSGSTAHAVLNSNNKDNESRHYIMVQLPEPCEENSESGKAGYKTIAEITKERVRRVIKKINEEESGQLPMGGKQDRGFRVFKLAESNFKGWDASAPKDGAALAQQLELHIDHIREGRTSEDILYEILLKSGFPLTTPVEKIELEGKAVYSVAGGGMLICLEKELTLEVIRSMAEKKPQRVICLDLGFAGNDQLKANAVQIFKTKEVVFKTV